MNILLFILACFLFIACIYVVVGGLSDTINLGIEKGTSNGGDLSKKNISAIQKKLNIRYFFVLVLFMTFLVVWYMFCNENFSF